MANSSLDRVRSHTAVDVLRRIDDTTASRLDACAVADPNTVAPRLDALDREWDTDRLLEAEAASMGLLGLALGSMVRPQLLALPAFVAASVLVHALTGRYPLMPIFRRLGMRTSREIARERYALALRGDFAETGHCDVGARQGASVPLPAGRADEQLLARCTRRP